jgi:general secretion pathway protein C
MSGHAALSDLLTRHPLARPLALAAIAALSVALLLVLARLTWLIVDLASPPEPAPAPVAAMAVPEAAPASLAGWHLFGNANPALDPRSAASNAPDTTLALTLHGVFAQDDPKTGRAIIGDANGPERAYVVGDELPGGVLLDSVLPDRVMLSRGGVLEALRLPREQGSATATAARGPVAGGTGSAPAPAPGAAAAVAAPGQPAPFVNPVMSLGAPDWSAATAGLGVDVAELARQVTALPVLEDGRFAGVRLSFGRDLPLAAKLGLEPDDVVTAINGTPLDSLENAQLAARGLAGARSATVTVRRGGQSQTLNVSLD